MTDLTSAASLPPPAGFTDSGAEEGEFPEMTAGRREPFRPDWASLWRLLVVQTQNAFHDKVAQFTLLGLAKVLLDRATSDRYAHLVSVLLVVPLLFFAPVTGWMSDRFSKRQVVLWCSISQVAVLLGIALTFWFGWFWVATGLFFLLALQAAIFQPAKGGIVKEYVGDKYLSIASGWAQMTAIMAFVAGQWIGGRVFEVFYENGPSTGNGNLAACLTTLILAALAVIPAVLAWQMTPTPSHCGESFRRGMLTEHFHHLAGLLRIRKLRLTALGVSFFWFAATLLTLILIQLATEIEPNEASQSERSGMLLAYVGAGVALGSLLVAWISAHKIELGLVPLGGFGMAAASVATLAVDPAGMAFRWLILIIGGASAVFLVPLNAYLQDQVEPQVRGRMLSAAGLLDSLAMLLSIGVQLLWLKLGVSVVWQLVMLGLLCLATSIYVLRIIPQNFLRFTVLGLIRIVYRTRGLHAKRLPERGGVLLVCNHLSYVDALILSAACEREVVFTVFEDFFKNPLLSGFMRLFGVVPISSKRAKDAIVTMADTLKEGQVVCIFPEGQLTRTGFMNEVRKGFELIARRGQAPVLPVYLDALWGSIFSFQGGKFFAKRPQRFPVHVTAVWGAPIPAGEVTAHGARQAFRQLSREGLEARPEVHRTLRLAAAEALCHLPWNLSLADADDPLRQLKRGLVFAQAMHLARRWESFPAERMAIVLPEGRATALALLALKFAGKVPLIIPQTALNHPGLGRLLRRARVQSVVSQAAIRAQHPDAPWPDHFLYFQSEMDELDDLHLLGDCAFATLAPAALRRLRMEWREGHDGLGWVSVSENGGLRLTLLTDQEVLRQVEAVRATDLLRESDRLLCGLSPASAGGCTALWSCLLRGIPIIYAAESAARRADRWCGEYHPTLALGGAGLAGGLTQAHDATLRAFLTWTGNGEPLPATISDRLQAATGAVACPGLTDEISGRLLAVSLPDPPLGSRTAEPQRGLQPGSPGRLLPGLDPSVLPVEWTMAENDFVIPATPGNPEAREDKTA
ncbi:MAG: MFS transporter [Verrucomicrobiota bacterium]